ncbi:MAG: hypothetical protein ACTS6H_02200 [Candidatus Hodgkinia cicadicola]
MSQCSCELRKRFGTSPFVIEERLELLWKLRLAPEAFDWFDLRLEVNERERRRKFTTEVMIKLISRKKKVKKVKFVETNFMLT